MDNTDLAAEPARTTQLLRFVEVKPILLLLLAGLLLRLWIASIIEGVPADLRLYVTWGTELSHDGPFHFYDTWKDYLPGYLYVLTGIGLLARVFSFNEQTWWYTIKVVSILADLASAYLLYLFLAPKPERIRLLAAGVYLCLPSVVLVSAAWGQSDSLLALPLFGSVYFISRDRPVAAAMSFTVAFMVKMLAIAVFPLLVVWILRDYKPKVWLQCAAAGALLAFAIVWPFFPDHPWDFFHQAYRSTSNFTFSALFTYNLWGAFGWFRQDSITTFGVSWHTWGFVLTIIGEAFVVLAFWRAKSPGAYALAVAMAMLVTYAFLSRMHERYIFAAFLPFLAACFLYNRWTLWCTFLVLSVIEFCGIFVAYYTLAEKREPAWAYHHKLWEWLNYFPDWWKHPGTPVEFGLSMILVATVVLLVGYSQLLGYRFRIRGGFRVDRVPIDPSPRAHLTAAPLPCRIATDPMPDANALKQRAAAEIDRRRDELVELSLRIHATPEIAFEEHKSSAALCDFLEANGFAVERGICEIPTAFRATAGSGAPRIAFVAEYDALPGVGHGCGHNIIGAASCAAGIAVKELLADAGGGTVVVMGTPAEEAAGGKVYMIDRGAFNGLDCAMMVHPGNRDTAVAFALACLELDVEFHGRAAHAAARPEAGRNALDAMVAAFVNIGLLRQQIRDSARIHGIITDGGQAVNVIPYHTAAKLLIRTEEDDYMDRELKPKVLACFEGAARATGCELEYRWGEQSRYKTMRTNMALAEAYRANVESLGRKTVAPESKRSMGSTDMGNVSQVIPGIHPGIAIAPQEVPIHTVEFREYAKSDAGHQGLVDAAKAMAMTGIDVLTDADLRKRMKDEFDGR